MRHRNRAGMPGSAAQAKEVTLDSAYGCDQTDRLVASFEYRPLFDMRFHIADDGAIASVEFGNGIGIEAEVGHCLPDRYAVPVAKIEARQVKGPGKRARPDQCGRKADAFLVGKGKHLDRKGQGYIAHFTKGEDRQKHTHDAVEHAAISYGVLMRSE